MSEEMSKFQWCLMLFVFSIIAGFLFPIPENLIGGVFSFKTFVLSEHWSFVTLAFPACAFAGITLFTSGIVERNKSKKRQGLNFLLATAAGATLMFLVFLIGKDMATAELESFVFAWSDAEIKALFILSFATALVPALLGLALHGKFTDVLADSK